MAYPTYKEIKERKLKEKLDKALEAERIKYPLIRPNGKFPVKEFLSDPEARGVMFDYLAGGHSMRQFCTDHKLSDSARVGLSRALSGLKAPDPRYEEYMQAKQARAHQFADRMLDMVEQVTMGVMTPQQGSFCVKSLQWLAERMDPEHFSGRIQVDANVKIDTATQHLEAVRQMANLVKSNQSGKIYQGKYVEQIPEPPEDPYALLE